MRYSEMIRTAINNSGMKLETISELVDLKIGTKPSIYYLSRIQNGKVPPAGEKLNIALSQILNIDYTDLRLAAYKEKIPNDVLEQLINETA
ncbi:MULTISPECIES: helix-turn-helix transcriptional regulator [unclassified Oceanobacillus]|uniref:helix-turn-helix domain-containing protein n=1 Tax=unclassified Oceanobacillus TaxID=2630292 RepID=UPI001BEB3059|nr:MULTISPECIES: helix-turn-helix transcriptional regulator [unclassified Oceanobacillus]MBT2601247.1 helix-turn-helix transcriptional regulator [Oceanobacillus sp. ISL-74]MBT2653647.1 helix-turn-helix transcriptional regulator [Oceanobacillus sp. ISL-73]